MIPFDSCHEFRKLAFHVEYPLTHNHIDCQEEDADRIRSLYISFVIIGEEDDADTVNGLLWALCVRLFTIDFVISQKTHTQQCGTQETNEKSLE